MLVKEWIVKKYGSYVGTKTDYHAAITLALHLAEISGDTFEVWAVDRLGEYRFCGIKPTK